MITDAIQEKHGHMPVKSGKLTIFLHTPIDRLSALWFSRRSSRLLRGYEVLAAFVGFYGFVVMFIFSSLRRNRREAREDAPVLTLASHGLMAASAAGGALLLSAAAWANFIA